MSDKDSQGIEERVKVDRKKFEQMLGDEAESFFGRVMKATNTCIMWPPKLKPGTKSKKDPHVRITGNPNSINQAKEMIFEQLDTRRNRVTLKMDVAFTDHSHIIGKGGRSIQRVMDETGCHIHFPDSNRTNTAEKSNQVSIAGSAEGVELSRRKIREMLPITLQFDLPLNNGLRSPPTLDPQSPQLQAIQQTYGITITFRCEGSKCSNNSYFASSRIITVAVRGARSHLFGLRQGLAVLIEYLTGFRANSINVPLTMTIDVAIQHHSFIAGRANCNLKSIMQSTGAVITMPELNNSAVSLSSYLSSSALLGGSSGDISNVGSSASAAVAAFMAARDPLNDQALTTSSQQMPFATLTNNNSDNNLFLNGSNSNLTTLSAPGTSSSSMNNISNSSNNNNNNNNNINSINNNINNNNNNNTNTNSLGCNRKTAIVVNGPNFDSVYDAWQELLGQLPLILIFDLKEGQDLDPVQVTKLMEEMRQISILIKPKQRQNTKSIVVRGPEKDSRLLFEVRRQLLQLDYPEPVAQRQALPMATSPSSPLSVAQSQDNLQMEALKAILEPDLTKPRQPTPYWHGLGFSKSVSEPMIKEKTIAGPLFSSNVIDERRTSYANDITRNLQPKKLNANPSLVDLNNNSPICVPPTNNNNQKVTSCLRLAVFLGRIGLVQYLSLFTQHNIDLEMLLSFGEANLAELGLPYTHRRKLAIAIAEVKSMMQNSDQRGSSTFDAAPGAERSRRQKTGPSYDLKDVWPM